MNLFRIKKLYSFVLKSFFPLLLATFSVCLFILLMQFLWTHVNDMVGKGVEIKILIELFFYASLSLTYMALPLSVLLASLMTFGNLGEHFELLAMKASGISLLKIMRPLIVAVVFIVFISFYFQNNIQPRAQVKMYTIIYSLRQKTPELDIPEGVFYNGIEKYNVYVRQKDKKNGLLLDMMIYDYSKGFENAVVIVADTGRLHVSSDRKNLVLTLYSGESFQNMETRRTRSIQENVPYQRETFGLRTILIPFDTNFTMIDESIMDGRDIGKNVTELTAFIDSTKHEMDSINSRSAPLFKGRVYTSVFKRKAQSAPASAQRNDTLFADGFQAYFNRLTLEKQLVHVKNAKNKADNIQNEYTYSSLNQTNTNKAIKSHEIQLQKKFALSLACFLFFFIGAPLGAIIRKGGLGVPAVLSVFLFILYYIIDLFGLKMAKQGVWPVWEGMWLSTLVLAALGAFFTYKAVNDSVMMNPDSWKTIFQNYPRIKKILRNFVTKNK